VGAQRKVDVIFGHRRLGGVKRDVPSPQPGAPTISVLEQEVSRDRTSE
jgi:hypothetical protein